MNSEHTLQKFEALEAELRSLLERARAGDVGALDEAATIARRVTAEIQETLFDQFGEYRQHRAGAQKGGAQ